MVRIHRPRRGSKSFYPKVRARQEKPNFSTKPLSTKAGPLNFYGYKAGMTHCIAKDTYKPSPTFNQEIQVPLTIIEVPEIFVTGIRLHKKTEFGKQTLKDFFVQPEGKEAKYYKEFFNTEKKKNIDEIKKEIENLKEQIIEANLIAFTKPYKTGFGKKAPELVEIDLGGKVEEQITKALELIGKDLKAKDVFAQNEFIDIKGVTKGKGWAGVIKRYGVKIQRQPKAKRGRFIGSVGPWHPATILWTVARPGQLGYFTRTEYNKKIILIEDNFEKINPSSGFMNYSKIKNPFIAIIGSAIGPSKRLIGMRKAIRQGTVPENTWKLSDLSYISLTGGQGK